MGGSASVRESGLTDAISSGNYVFYDRDKASTPEEKQEIALKAFTCDWYLGSVNAMSEDGVFCEYRRKREPCGCICVRSEKCSPYCRNEQGGQDRGGRHAQSQKRGGTDQLRSALGSVLPCVKNGSCSDCKSPDCICCQIMVTRFSRIPKRFKIILVDENLGF